MHDSNFWYQYSTVGPRGAREGPGGAQHPLAPPQIRLCLNVVHCSVVPVLSTGTKSNSNTSNLI